MEKEGWGQWGMLSVPYDMIKVTLGSSVRVLS